MISLNGVCNINSMLKYLEYNKGKYQDILLALDNDIAGQKALSAIKEYINNYGSRTYIFKYKEKDPNMQLLKNPRDYSCLRL